MTAAPPYSVESDACVYAIGDIHGRLDLLSALVARIAKDAARFSERKTVVFLGDYIDRGAHSKEVIDFLLNDLPTAIEPVFLRGNHEETLLQFLDGDVAVGQSWLQQFGGNAALASYGINPYLPGAVKDLAAVREALVERIPQPHKDFFAATRFSYTNGGYYFVHAGVRPGVPLERQVPADQLWVRDLFLTSPLPHGKRVVHGHSITRAPDILPHRIGIDTGAYATGKLTCLRLRGEECKFLTT